MPEICAIPIKLLYYSGFRFDGLITPTLKAAGSNPVGRTKSIPDLLFGMLFIIKNISLSLGES